MLKLQWQHQSKEYFKIFVIVSIFCCLWCIATARNIIFFSFIFSSELSWSLLHPPHSFCQATWCLIQPPPLCISHLNHVPRRLFHRPRLSCRGGCLGISRRNDPLVLLVVLFAILCNDNDVISSVFFIYSTSFNHDTFFRWLLIYVLHCYYFKMLQNWNSKYTILIKI